jgi:hypothetical protein
METRSSHVTTKTDRALEDRMLAVAGDAERVEVIARARTFKRSWIELAESLTAVFERGSWERWGFESFQAYCKTELCLTPSTATKLLGSFRFLRTDAPQVIRRAREEPSSPVPSLKAVDFVARASERGAAGDEAMREIRRAAFEEGTEAPALSRRFKSIAFPVSEEDREGRLRGQLSATARRLAQLIAEPDSPVPHEVAVAVEEAVGRLLESLDE